MNFPYFIAKRVALGKQRTFSRLIIRIAVVAVALSMAVMIASTALISGFKKEISGKIFGFWGHIHIIDPDLNRSLLEVYPISKKQDFYPSLDTTGPISYLSQEVLFGKEVERERMTNGGIRHIQVFAIQPGIIKADNEIEGIILKGIDKDFDWHFLKDYLVAGDTLNLSDSLMSSDILISQQTANRVKVEVGDRFELHFVVNGEMITRRFTIGGIYKTGLDEYDRRFALVDIRKIQQLLKWPEDQISGFEVFLDDLDDLRPFADYIYLDQIPVNSNLYAETIREKLPEIFEWLDLQDVNEVVILGLMVIVAIINMITALLILILERTNMIGILKALGAGNWGIRKLFLIYAAYIVLLGLFWGNFIGLGLCWLQDTFEFISLDEENYYLSVAPVSIQWWTVLVLNVGTLLITIIFLILPSYLITRISPVRAIRFK